ncbi:MAG TPA: hypothetical protein VEH57_01370, partial [Thermoplasmata archaeon]|nr:hypothetical protein [Thermoplasmata archaeon]
TLPPRAFPPAARAVRKVGGRLTAVGQVRPGRGAWLRSGGRVTPMPPAGWAPFSARRRPLG